MHSRSDAYFGNALVFNQSVFDETKKYWTDDWVTIKMAAKARLARIKTSNATNPTYQLSPLGDAFTYGESAAYVVVFGDKSKGRVKRSWVKWLFGKPASRFPILRPWTLITPPPFSPHGSLYGYWLWDGVRANLVLTPLEQNTKNFPNISVGGDRLSCFRLWIWTDTWRRSRITRQCSKDRRQGVKGRSGATHTLVGDVLL